MAEYENQARQCLAKKFALKSTKTSDAADLYTKAGNLHKSAKAWKEAGEAYLKAGELYKQVDSTFLSMSALQHACAMLLRSTAVEDHDKARDIYDGVLIPEWVLTGGSHERIGSAHEALALKMEGDGKLRDAVDRWSLAVEAYTVHGRYETCARRCSVHCAWLRAVAFAEYREAVAALEHAAEVCLSVDLLKFHATPHLCDALFCSLATGDLVMADRNLARYRILDPNFQRSSSDRLATALVKAFGDRDPDAFTTAVADYDQYERLDNNQVIVLGKVKASLLAVDLA
jgi:alpha-soluble NSF attachment protein